MSRSRFKNGEYVTYDGNGRKYMVLQDLGDYVLAIEHVATLNRPQSKGDVVALPAVRCAGRGGE